MTEDEIEAVAAELAKAGGISWHRGAERGPLHLVMDRYRDRARLVIAALDRVRTAKQGDASDEALQREPVAAANMELGSSNAIATGALVLYRPAGDRRTYPCRIERIDGSRVHLVPEIPNCTGWVDLASLLYPTTQ